MVAFCVKMFKQKNRGKDPSKNPRALRRLRTECEKAKIQLSFSVEVSLSKFFVEVQISSVC